MDKQTGFDVIVFNMDSGLIFGGKYGDSFCEKTKEEVDYLNLLNVGKSRVALKKLITQAVNDILIDADVCFCNYVSEDVAVVHLQSTDIDKELSIKVSAIVLGILADTNSWHIKKIIE